MNASFIRRWALFSIVTFSVTFTLRAATRAKANNADNLNLASSWTNNLIPGSADVAQFDNVITGPLTLSLGADIVWNQINFVNPAGDVTINAGNLLTLSNNTPIIFGSGTANLTLNCDVFCAGATFANLPGPPAGRTLTYGGAIQGRNATVIIGPSTTGTLRLGSALTTLIGTNTQANSSGPRIGIGASSIGNPIVSGPLGATPFVWGSSTGTELFAYNGAQTLGNQLRFLTSPLTFNSADDLTFSSGVDLAGGNRTFNVTSNGVLRLTGIISNGVALVKTGPGVLGLGGTNVAAFGSGLSIFGGTVRLLNSEVIPDAASAGTLRMTNVTEVLDLNGFNETVRGVAGSGGSGNFNGTIDNTAAGTTSTLTLGDAFTYTITGNLQNSGSAAKLALAKIGTGGLILTNAKSFGGGITNASASQLFINSAGAAGTGPVVLTDPGAKLSYSGGGSITWTNDIILGAGTQPIISANDANTLTIAGIISGPGLLRRTSDLFEQGSLNYSGDNTFTGGFLLFGGTVTFSHARAAGRGVFRIGDTTFTGTSITVVPGVNLSGATAITNPVVINRNFTAGGTNRIEFSGPVTLATTAPQPSINVTNPAGMIISGPIGGAGFGFNKTGAGVLTVAGVSTYDGTTSISSGPLAIGAGGALTSSTQILVGVTGLLDVTAAAGFAIAPSQTLNGTGKVRGDVTVNGKLIVPSPSIPFTFSNNLTLTASSTTTVNINRAIPLFEKIICYGTLTYGGTLVVNNFGAALQAGDVLDLFGFSGSPGSFASLSLPALTNGLAWNTSSLAVDGTIRVVTAGPQFSNPILLNPSNFVVTVTGGTSNSQFRVLSQTNLTIPVTNWQIFSTNVFDSAGNFIVTNAVNPADRQRFFIISQP